jgi:hypothetical protein
VADDGKRETARGGTAQYQESGARRRAKADHFQVAQEDPHGAGQAGRQGREAAAQEKT